ncbi:GNAT family N-acetyltransferase [Fictibacillus sp. Mic-4]|uniref:GNAT family N-acetyltransferase n=2 Tax=Fictibacillus TaxID=1329200 RepID=UPI003CF44939
MNIRKARVEDARPIAKVHVESWRTTYKGMMEDDVLKQLSVDEREQKWKKIIMDLSEEFLYVAENDKGEVAGFASGGPSRSPEFAYDGELYAIYILQEYQQKGIGRKLISKIAEKLLENGYQSMIVWVLKDNQAAKQAYIKLGGKVIGKKDIQIGKRMLVEEAFVWEDLTGFL